MLDAQGAAAHAMTRIQLRATCYIDDCPPGRGGLLVWPRSHLGIWQRWQECLGNGWEFSPHRNPAAAAAKERTAPVECCGDAGTVVLWHETMLHNQGVNAGAVGAGGVIRQAIHTDFHKTVASVPDALLRGGARTAAGIWGIWRDWSDAVRQVGDDDGGQGGAKL